MTNPDIEVVMEALEVAKKEIRFFLDEKAYWKECPHAIRATSLVA